MLSAKKAIPSHLYPRLKSGVRTSPTVDGKSFYVGHSQRGLLFSSHELFPLIKRFDGRISLAELETLFPELALDLASALEQLLGENLLELHPAALTRTTTSAAAEFASIQFAPELHLASWRGGTTDDGFYELSRRSQFAILIIGGNRLALTLHSLLLASGFALTKVVAGDRHFVSKFSQQHNEVITPEDVCGLTVRLSDVGCEKEEFISKLSTTSSSFYSTVNRYPEIESSFPNQPHLIIATEIAQPDYVQRWMSEGTPYLQIAPIVGSVVEVGPLVLPGKSPCLRCVRLQQESNLHLEINLDLPPFLEKGMEFPAASVALLTGVLATHVIEMSATQSSSLIGCTVRYNLHEVCKPEHIYWQPHSLCGCIEVI